VRWDWTIERIAQPSRFDQELREEFYIMG